MRPLIAGLRERERAPHAGERGGKAVQVGGTVARAAARRPAAPVGAQTSMFSLEAKAVRWMRDWMRLSVL